MPVAVSCVKEFTIPQSQCDAFDALSWGAPITDPVASGSFVANNFSLSASLNVPAAFAASIQCTGSFTYTGPEVTCNFQLIVTDLTAVSDVGVTVEVDAVEILYAAKASYLGDFPGTFNYSLTIPASVGANVTVFVAALAGGGDFSGVTGSVAASGSFG